VGIHRISLRHRACRSTNPSRVPSSQRSNMRHPSRLRSLHRKSTSLFTFSWPPCSAKYLITAISFGTGRSLRSKSIGRHTFCTHISPVTAERTSHTPAFMAPCSPRWSSEFSLLMRVQPQLSHWYAMLSVLVSVSAGTNLMAGGCGEDGSLGSFNRLSMSNLLLYHAGAWV